MYQTGRIIPPPQGHRGLSEAKWRQQAPLSPEPGPGGGALHTCLRTGRGEGEGSQFWEETVLGRPTGGIAGTDAPFPGKHTNILCIWVQAVSSVQRQLWSFERGAGILAQGRVRQGSRPDSIHSKCASQGKRKPSTCLTTTSEGQIISFACPAINYHGTPKDCL